MNVAKMSNTQVYSPEAVLASLHEAAEHKASLKMFFAAAELCREYHGAFADETKARREGLAVEYEERGRSIEHERQLHGPAPHSAATWHCPACQAEFPERLVVCGNCSFDLRTGKKFVAEGKPWPEMPPRWSSSTKVTHAHAFVRRRHEDTSMAWLVGVFIAIVFIVVLLGLGKEHLTSDIAPARPASSGR